MPCCARYMKIVTGSRVRDEALSTRKRICALLAVVLLGLSSCNAFIAFRPIGVAALSRPRPLAAKFRVIRPIAGCPGGTSGISRRNSGPSSTARRSTSPAFSAMRRKPSQSVRVPNSRTITSTASLAMANRLSTIAANTVASPPINQRASALAAATRKKPNHKPFSIQNPPRCADDSGAGGAGARNAEAPDDAGASWAGSRLIRGWPACPWLRRPPAAGAAANPSSAGPWPRRTCLPTWR